MNVDPSTFVFVGNQIRVGVEGAAPYGLAAPNVFRGSNWDHLAHLGAPGQISRYRVDSDNVASLFLQDRIAMKAISAKCGHVKRRLRKGQPLTGELLKFALDVLPEDTSPAFNGGLVGIREKLVAGHQLGEYEYHLFVEVILLHVRLSAA